MNEAFRSHIEYSVTCFSFTAVLAHRWNTDNSKLEFKCKILGLNESESTWIDAKIVYQRATSVVKEYFSKITDTVLRTRLQQFVFSQTAP